MARKTLLTIFLISLNFISPLYSQQSHVIYLEQTIAAQPYQGKAFRFSAYVTFEEKGYSYVDLIVSAAKAGQQFEDQVHFFKRSYPQSQWKMGKQFIRDTIPLGMDSITVGAYLRYGGPFLLDDFSLEIETSPGEWTLAPLKNPGFEDWSDQGKLEAWHGSLYSLKNFKVERNEIEAREGEFALKVYSKDQDKLGKLIQVPQKKSTQKFEVREGANENTDKRIMLQDHLGFFWKKSQDGLIRFDGYDDKYYSPIPGDSTSISSRQVSSIYEERGGNLWVSTWDQGLDYFDRKTETFHRYQNDPNDPNSIPTGMASVVHNYPNDQVLVITSRGFYELNKTTGQFKKAPFEPSNRILSVGGGPMVEDEKGTLWFVSQRSLHEFNPANNQIKNYPILDNIHLSPSSNVLIGPDGMLWMTTFDGHLLKFNPKTKVFESRYFFEKLQIVGSIRIAIDRNGNIWIPGANNSIIIQFNTHSTYYIKHEMEERVWSVLVDKDGSVWTQGEKNTYKLDPFSSRFKELHLNAPPSNSTDKNSIDYLYEDSKGNIWAHNRGKTLIRLRPNHKELFYAPETAFDLDFFPSLNAVRDIFQVNDHTFWVGNLNYENTGGLFVLDPDTGNATKVMKPPMDMETNINDMIAMGDSCIWISGVSSLYSYDKRTDTFEIFPVKHKGKEQYFEGNKITNFLKDRNGDIWLAMSSGLLKKYDPETGLFEAFNPNPNDPLAQFGENWINAIIEDADGNFWLGTSDGLKKFDPETKIFVAYGKQDGLAHNLINALVADHHGNIWIGTAEGLSQFNPKTERFRNYSSADGLPSNDIKSAVVSRESGVIYIGTDDRLCYFHPDSLKENRTPPPVFITSLTVINKDRMDEGPLPVKGISMKESVTLSYKDDILNFTFAALSYSNTPNNQYAYMLEGVIDEWVALGAKREVTFTNLAPGNYILRVKGSNGDGVWNEEGVALTIRITPPWWQTTWAYAIYAILVLLSGFWLYQFLLSRRLEKEEAKRLKELDQVKTKLYTNISHEFRTPLTVISGMSDKIQENPRKWAIEGTDLIKRNSRYLLKLVNQILDLRKLESGSLKINYVQGDIVTYLQYLTQSFQLLATDKDIRLHFYSEEKELFMDFDPDKMQHIFTNLLSNAIKFTPEGGDVYVRVQGSEFRVQGKTGGKHEGRYLLLTIRDTGIGIPENQLPHIFDRFYQVDDSSTRKGEHLHQKASVFGDGTGIGLALTKELVQLLEGTISVKSDPGAQSGAKGTEFTVQLPISNEGPLKDLTFNQDKDAMAAMVVTGADLLEKSTAFSTTIPLALIIEDNADVAKYLFSCLEDDYQLNWAKNGQQGIDMAMETTPDIIISDVMMPLKDGLEVCQELKQNVRTSHIPIILLTAKADIDSKLEGLSHGADAYLAKPFNPEELKIRLQKLIELRRQLQNHYSQYEYKTDKTQNLEEEFLTQLRSTIQENLANEHFGVQQLSRAMAMSRSQLHRKIKALTNKSTSSYIRTIRLTKARELLKTKDMHISEIAYEVGFSSPVYFTQTFSEEFGVPPSEMRY